MRDSIIYIIIKLYTDIFKRMFIDIIALESLPQYVDYVVVDIRSSFFYGAYKLALLLSIDTKNYY